MKTLCYNSQGKGILAVGNQKIPHHTSGPVNFTFIGREEHRRMAASAWVRSSKRAEQKTGFMPGGGGGACL